MLYIKFKDCLTGFKNNTQTVFCSKEWHLKYMKKVEKE